MRVNTADLSSWYEFWFAIICIDMNVILDRSTTIQQFQRRFRLPNWPGKWSNTRNPFYWNTTTGNNSSTDRSLLRKNVKIKCKEYFSRLPVGVKSNNDEFPDCTITCHTRSTTAGSRSGKTSQTECILDSNVRSLYRRIFQQLNTTSILDRFHR